MREVRPTEQELIQLGVGRAHVLRVRRDMPAAPWSLVLEQAERGARGDARAARADMARLAGRMANRELETDMASDTDWVTACEDRLAELTSGGMSKTDAISQIANFEPRLHHAYIAAINREVEAKAAKASATPAKPPVVEQFDARVTELRDKGLSHEDALGRIMDEDPGSYENYLAAYNEQPGADMAGQSGADGGSALAQRTALDEAARPKREAREREDERWRRYAEELRPRSGATAAEQLSALGMSAGPATIQAPQRAFCLTVPPEAYEFVTADDGTRRARMHALTGKPLQHWYWDTIIFDLDGLKAQKKKLAGLVDHHPGLRVCVWDGFEVHDDGLFVQGYFLDNPNAKQILADLDKGFPFEGSIHFNRRESKIEQLAPDAEAEVNGHSIEGPAFIVRKAVIDEVSWCVHGVDYETAGTALKNGNDEVGVAIVRAAG